MGKVELNKKLKKESLLNTAFSLFTSKGFQNTSISDIVRDAGVAKGTFYLYFTDKYDIRNKLIAHKATILLYDAYDFVCSQKTEDFEEQIIQMTDYIVERLNNDKSLLNFISKHLSWGIFRNSLISFHDDQDHNAYELFVKLLHDSGYEFRDPEIMIYLIIELVSGAIYNPILYEQPVPLEQIKPYLYESIRSVIHRHIIFQADNKISARDAEPE
ncbi:MAG: TetR/AcrR family transcriptional regulator [Lachnospiraceae bacterium]|nr:TetR/AcrR family transcriptional regulator [Lachnospiraceae bacterium]